jgi:hypothetical protein
MSSVDDEKYWKIVDDMLSSLWVVSNVVSNHLYCFVCKISYLMRTLVSVDVAVTFAVVVVGNWADCCIKC